jgi:predicted O-methyltransferase YrrM
MFHNIPESMMARMRHLEKLDTQDRIDGTPRMERLRQIPPETGKSISILAINAPKGEFLEMGTRPGYSILWIALACRLIGNKIITFEILTEKVKLAKETFELTNIKEVVELIEGDARETIFPIIKIYHFVF